MSQIRSEIWCSAFVRQHNNQGQICVVAKKGDPIAGQIWIEVDHLDGNSSLFSQASSSMQTSLDGTLLFQQKFDQIPYLQIKQRIDQEKNFDPDFWLLVLEDPRGEHGLTLTDYKL